MGFDLARWAQIGLSVKEMRRALHRTFRPGDEVSPRLGKDFNRTVDALERLASDMEDEFCREYPELFSPDVFYGP
jgi:hypothetical protein